MDLLVKEKLSAQEPENYGSEIQTKLRIRMQIKNANLQMRMKIMMERCRIAVLGQRRASNACPRAGRGQHRIHLKFSTEKSNVMVQKGTALF